MQSSLTKMTFLKCEFIKTMVFDLILCFIELNQHKFDLKNVFLNL